MAIDRYTYTNIRFINKISMKLYGTSVILLHNLSI